MQWIIYSFLLWIQFQPVNVTTLRDCEVLFEGVDLESKLLRKELAANRVINFTPPELRNDLLGRDLLTADGRLSKIGDDTYLMLDIVINSPKAKELYGTITAGSQMKLILIDNKEVLIRIDTDIKPMITRDQSGYKYSISSLLDARTQRQLQKAEIDKWGIVYASGYEEYTIYELDFFINQLACLEDGEK